MAAAKSGGERSFLDLGCGRGGGSWRALAGGGNVERLVGVDVNERLDGARRKFWESGRIMN
jgi:ubiquinone/menaquinone biosynthesis C-methylase UbiE